MSMFAVTQLARSFCVRNFLFSFTRTHSRKTTVIVEKGTVPDLKTFLARTQTASDSTDQEPQPHYTGTSFNGAGLKVYLEIFGCQMNVNDGEIVRSILSKSGYVFCNDIDKADVALLMTCSIREGAEQKIWHRLKDFRYLKYKRQLNGLIKPVKIGILGCMAERLKEKVLEKEKSVDVVCGPDAYRDLPRLLAVTDNDHAAVNVLLSLEETYADVTPVRANPGSPSAFVSIQRGCDNMCSFCVVPFTRGRERSRSIESILNEIKVLLAQGVKEVTLLGQNVNSYHDVNEMVEGSENYKTSASRLSPGFTTIYRHPKSGGRSFAELLDQAALLDPELRIRFTSPHPKDFNDDVLTVMRRHPNICKHIHLPAQSGNSQVLEAMRRGYTREAYLSLVERIRSILPEVSLSSDFIAGFCGETEEAHKETVDLIHRVKYNFAYCFPYSMRQKTHAYHRLKDDVSDDVKGRRHMELCAAFRATAQALNDAQIGQAQLVLVEGQSRRSSDDLVGRNDGNTKVNFPKRAVADRRFSSNSDLLIEPKVGDYVVVEICRASSQTLGGQPLFLSTITDFEKCRLALKNDAKKCAAVE